MKILAGLLLLVWCAQSASLGHIHYIPGAPTPVLTHFLTVTGQVGKPTAKSHRNGIRDGNCPLCQLSVHMAVLTVPLHIVFIPCSSVPPRITPALLRGLHATQLSHNWIGRAPPV